ncbi:hypothetical protein K490DRAFT_63130 [Saccharata proteae CBS 121410]|uniref:Uncharacterized protein n=1 Tax=Saccharata proteae CBS 121410 TaxID=1314787 RepID=A0A9P4I1P1_9PEZI|nr:hypothetical protein K490DRAFT_63130 [Saccharata proteae CBS 121410]
MAYSSYDYDHDDDHRPRHSASRRDDDYATPPSRHHDHSKYPPHEQPVRSRPSVVPTDGSRDYSYDARYRNPLPPRTSSFRSERRARPRWPPQPTVEDEAESLIKEHGAHTSLHGENLEGWVMRGTVDQEPIMVEVSPQPNNSDNQERRFVLVPGSEAEETEFEETPIYPRREPSPYAFTKPDVSSKGRSAGDSFLSPDTVTPSSATRPNRRPDETASSRKSNRNSFLSPESYQNTGALEDSDLSEDESIKLRTERKPARYSFSPAELKKEDLRTSLRDLEPKFEKDRPSARPRSTSTAYSFSPADLKKEDLRTSLRDPEPKIERDRPSGRPRSVSTAYSFGPGELRTEDHKAPLRNPEPPAISTLPV